MSGFYEWESIKEMSHTAAPQVSYSIMKYDQSIRKQAALVRRDGVQSKAIAWFPSEQDALDFCEMLLGGVHRYDTPS